MDEFILDVSQRVFWDYGLVRTINLAHRIGFRAFELWAEPRVVDPLSANLNFIENLRSKFIDLGFRVSMHSAHWDVNLASLNPHIRRLSIHFAKATLLMAKLLNAGLVIIRPGEALTNLVSKRMVERLVLQSLEEIVDYAMDIGGRVAIENMELKFKRYIFSSPHDISNLIELIESSCGVEVDLASNAAHASTVMDPVEFIDELDVDIVHVYFSDAVGGNIYLPIGEGSINFDEIFRCMSKHNYIILVWLSWRDMSLKRIMKLF